MKKEQEIREISFSILIANYNNSTYIEEAINSVINQTFTKWELIIVDDHSFDNSIEKISPYLKDNNNIKLIQNKKNLGVGASKKIAAENANNQILGILDADDKLHERALERMVEAYQKFPEHGLIYSTMWNCDSNLTNCKIDKTLGPIIPEKTSIFQPKISHFKTFRRDEYLKTSGYDPRLKKGVDRDIIFKLEEICNLKFIDDPLYYYRQHPGGISQGKNAFLSRVYCYIVKCKTYRRRLNTNLPNYNLKDLNLEYYKITFHNLIFFIIKLIKCTKIKLIIEKLSEKSSIINNIIQKTKFLRKILDKI